MPQRTSREITYFLRHFPSSVFFHARKLAVLDLEGSMKHYKRGLTLGNSIKDIFK
jgi:hypothetical protein